MVKLDHTIGKLIADKNVIVFDGECVLCNRFFKFVYKHDAKAQFHFMTAQSVAGEALYQQLGLKQQDYATNLVLIEGALYVRMRGVFEVLKRIGFPWRMLNFAAVLPDFVLDWLYYRIARNRYRIFGRYGACFVPTERMKGRFLEL